MGSSPKYLAASESGILLGMISGELLRFNFSPAYPLLTTAILKPSDLNLLVIARTVGVFPTPPTKTLPTVINLQFLFFLLISTQSYVCGYFFLLQDVDIYSKTVEKMANKL